MTWKSNLDHGLFFNGLQIRMLFTFLKVHKENRRRKKEHDQAYVTYID